MAPLSPLVWPRRVLMLYLGIIKKHKRMSTNATVKIQKEDETLCTLYVHWDGYWKGLGQDIVNILSEGKLVNGLSIDKKLGEQFNGAGCLATTLIAKLKTEPGNIYLMSEEEEDPTNHHYVVKVTEHDSIIKLYHNGELKWAS